MPNNNIEGLRDYSVERLNSRFKAWVAPQQADFHALIALADIGRQAVGGGAELASTGLQFHGETGPLSLILPPAGGLLLDRGSLKLRVGDGVEVNDSGGLALALKSGVQGACLAIEGGVLKLKVDSSGLSQDGELSVSVGGSVQSSSGLALKLASAPSGLQVDSRGLAVRCDPGGGLSVNAEGKLTLDLEFLMGI